MHNIHSCFSKTGNYMRTYTRIFILSLISIFCISLSNAQSLIQGPKQVCVGQDATFYIDSVPVTGWSIDGGITLQGSSDFVTYSDLAAGTYVLEAYGVNMFVIDTFTFVVSGNYTIRYNLRLWQIAPTMAIPAIPCHLAHAKKCVHIALLHTLYRKALMHSGK